MTSVARRLAALVVASAVVGATLTTVSAPPASASWSFPNIEIANQARSYELGSWGGQCKVFGATVVNAVLAANNISARVGGYGSPGGAYYGAYKNAGGTLVSLKAALPGDVIQTVNKHHKHSDHPPLSGLHTAIIVARTSSANVVVVRDSNYSSPGDERVREHTWDPVAFAATRNSAVYVWRFGRVATTPWAASVIGQSSWSDAGLSKPWDLTKAYAGETGYLKFQLLNTGTGTWSSTGTNPVRLGTALPQDRASPLYVAGEWLTPSRPASVSPASVAPGQVGTFTFPVTVPAGDGTLHEDFRLVAEDAAWFGPTVSTDLVRRSLSGEFVGKSAWLDADETQPWDLSQAYPGQTGYLKFRLRNTGSRTWTSGGDNPVQLGTWGPADRKSPFYVDGEWITPSRATSLSQATVQPGQIGSFSFPIRVPSGSSTVRERYRAVAEGWGWFGPGMGEDVSIDRLPSAFSAQATAQTLTYGDGVTVKGHLASGGHAMPDTSVTLMRRVAGTTTWKPRATLTTGPRGWVSAALRPTASADFKFVYAGALSYHAAASLPVPVHVRTTVDLRLKDASVAKGDPIVFTGAVAPNRGGESVLLQRRKDGAWVTVNADALSKASRYRFELAAAKSGVSQWRVVDPRRVDHLAGLSPVTDLTVT